MGPLGGIGAAARFFGAAPLLGQDFRRNKVQDNTFPFRIIPTQPFHTHSNPARATRDLDLAPVAERRQPRA